MNTIYTIAIVGFLIGLICAKVSKGNAGTYTFGMVLGTVLGGVVGLIVGLFVGGLLPMRDVVYGPLPLVSMRSSDGINGSFIWGTGSVNSQLTYHFLQRKEDGSMSPRSVRATEAVHLIEDAELSNTGFWSTTMSEPDKSHWLFNWSLATRDRIRVVRQEFRVPVGTVVQQFNIR